MAGCLQHCVSCDHQRLMPASKKKGKGSGSGGKKKKKGAKATAEKDEIVKLCKSLLKCYQLHCTSKESIASPRVCQEIRNSIENEIALSKVSSTNCDCSFSHTSPIVEILPKFMKV